MGLVSYNKTFLYAAVGAPGSTHDWRLLKNKDMSTNFRRWNISREMFTFMVTIGDSAFPQHGCLLEAYKENAKVDKKGTSIKNYAVLV